MHNACGWAPGIMSYFDAHIGTTWQIRLNVQLYHRVGQQCVQV